MPYSFKKLNKASTPTTTVSGVSFYKLSGGPSVNPVFGNNTPDVISAVSAEIAAQNMTPAQVYNTYGWSIGDTITIPLNNVNYDFRIMDFNHDILSSDHTSKAGITLQMVNCLNTLYSMNSQQSNAGGWNSCTLRSTLRNTIYYQLPSSWRSVIKLVDKKSANGGSTNYSATITSSDSLFILSFIEVWGFAGDAQDGANEGTRYQFWADNFSERIKSYSNNGVSTNVLWWERSCFSKNIRGYLGVDEMGFNSYTSANNNFGVSFAFCV